MYPCNAYTLDYRYYLYFKETDAKSDVFPELAKVLRFDGYAVSHQAKLIPKKLLRLSEKISSVFLLI